MFVSTRNNPQTTFTGGLEMILQPLEVELTKIHYFGKEDSEFSAKKNDRQSEFNKNVIIRKNVFGQRWVLEINAEQGGAKRKGGKVKVVVYVAVFCSIIVAVGFGIFLSIDKHIFQNMGRTVSNNSLNFANITEENLNSELQDRIRKDETDRTLKGPTLPEKPPFCAACIPHREICLKTRETDRPHCVATLDPADPTGCGGLCQIGTHYCQTLDRKARVFQCSRLKTTLQCADETFSCGNMCVSAKSRCDGVMDCSDGSDEKNCNCDLKTHFHCGNSTSCLESSKKCDKNLDCWDKSDEEDCIEDSKCEKDEFPCSHIHCIPREKFCDGNVDCANKTDEPQGC